VCVCVTEVLHPAKTYDDARRAFRWDIPARYNIGVDTADKHVATGDGDRLALIYERENGDIERYSFRDIARQSNRFANLLLAQGIRPGDRVGILLPQRPETAIAHVAVYKAGMVAVPLFTLFGPDALEYRLADSAARALITDTVSLEKLAGIRARLPQLTCLFVVDGAGTEAGPAIDVRQAIETASDRFAPRDTAADEPALIIYTSGTTGPPKGALHAHRVLLGHLPGVEMPHEFFPQPDDLFWTPADWAWIGGLFDVLLPAWHHGVPVLAYRFRKFDPEEAFALMARHGVRNVFVPPTALKLMRQVPHPLQRHPFVLRSVGSGGETLGAELLDWGRAHLGLTINEFYGQTECNLVVANCAGIMAPRPGSMGRPVPGHDVAIVDEGGNVLPAAVEGEIAIRRPDPVMFLRYWNNPEATAPSEQRTPLRTPPLLTPPTQMFLCGVACTQFGGVDKRANCRPQGLVRLQIVARISMTWATAKDCHKRSFVHARRVGTRRLSTPTAFAEGMRNSRHSGPGLPAV